MTAVLFFSAFSAVLGVSYLFFAKFAGQFR